MAMLACFLWWIVLGGLLGWLASWLVGKSLEGPAPAPVERIVEKPIDRVVEKIVDRPVEKIIEKVVEKKVDNPVHLARIGALEAEVALIAGLRSQISQLQSAPPKVVEKIVEKPVDRIVERVVEKPVDRIVETIVEKPVEKIVERFVEKPVEKIVEKPVDRIVEKIVERPVEKIVEKVVERKVDNPAHLSRITALEAEVAVIAGLRSQLLQLQSAPPKVVETIIEKPVEKIVEKVVERPVEKIVVDTQGLQERDQQIAMLRARVSELDGELGRLRRPAIDLAAAKAAGFGIKSADDLEVIEGIGPKIAELLRAEGILTFEALARTAPSAIQAILDKAGPNFRMANPASWPEQSGLAADNQWTALKALQDRLNAGNR